MKRDVCEVFSFLNVCGVCCLVCVWCEAGAKQDFCCFGDCANEIITGEGKKKRKYFPHLCHFLVRERMVFPFPDSGLCQSIISSSRGGEFSKGGV